MGAVLNRNLGKGVRPTQQNPDPVQDTKDVNCATLSKRKCCNLLPCSRLDKVLPYSMEHKLAFSHISMKWTKSVNIMWSKGAKRRSFCGNTLFRQKNVKLYTLFKTEDPENDTLTGGMSLWIGNIWEYPPPPPPPPTGILSQKQQTHSPPSSISWSKLSTFATPNSLANCSCSIICAAMLWRVGSIRRISPNFPRLSQCWSAM